jgi:hypothetical protein
MRKLLTAIGILFGAYAGWRLGAGFDGLISDFMERTPGHLQSFAFTGLFAAFGGYGFNRAAIALTRKPARVIELVPVDEKRPRVSTGRTPPTPRAAFQA